MITPSGKGIEKGCKIMDNLEKVEKIREKTGVTYEEAKKALEACNWDVLDAIVYLETLGRIDNPTGGVYRTSVETSKEFKVAKADYEDQTKGSDFGDTMGRFGDWIGRTFEKLMQVKFTVTRHEKELMSVPSLVLIFALLILPITLPLAIVGLFFDCRYHFDGADTVSVNVNEALNKAGNVAEDVKAGFAENKKNKKNDSDNENN